MSLDTNPVLKQLTIIGVIEVGAGVRDVPAEGKDRRRNLGDVLGQIIGIVINREGVDLVIVGINAEAQVIRPGNSRSNKPTVPSVL